MENIKKYSEYNVSESKKISRFPELDKIAKKLSTDFLKVIYKETKDVESEMPYKSQYVLEEVIKYLEERV